MNILFLSSENPYPPDHGHRIRTFNILKIVAKHHTVHFIGFIKNKVDIQYVEPIRKMCKTADVFIIPDDISKLRFIISLIRNIFSPLPYIVQKYYRNEMQQKIREILNINKIDLVHFDILPIASYRKDIQNIPSILIQHNVESLRVKRLSKNSSNLFFKLFMYIQYIKLYYFEKKECSYFNVCAAVSKNDMEILKIMCPEANLIVIPNGVDTNYFSPHTTNKIIPNSLLWVGGMKDMYNREAIDYFCKDIFHLIYQEIPDVKLTVVGKSPTKKLLRLTEINTNVKSVGYVDDVRPYIDSATIFIAPIKSGGGTKIKVLNALSMAKPVVATSIGAEGINVKDYEHLLIADDPRLFAKKTVELLRSPELAAKLGENGRRLMVKEYDWEIIGRKMNEVYAEATNSKIQMLKQG